MHLTKNDKTFILQLSKLDYCKTWEIQAMFYDINYKWSIAFKIVNQYTVQQPYSNKRKILLIIKTLSLYS